MPIPTHPSAETKEDPAGSPCVGICRVDGQDVCVGCGRTIDEITQWSRSDVTRRLQINARAAERRRLRALAPSEGPRR